MSIETLSVITVGSCLVLLGIIMLIRHLGGGFDVRYPIGFKYFEVQTVQGARPTRFKRDIIFGTLYVFQANCAPDGHNIWNEPGYGYGRWKKV